MPVASWLEARCSSTVATLRGESAMIIQLDDNKGYEKNNPHPWSGIALKQGMHRSAGERITHAEYSPSEHTWLNGLHSWLKPQTRSNIWERGTTESQKVDAYEHFYFPSFTFVYNNTEPQHFNMLLLEWEFLGFSDDEYTQLMAIYTQSLYYVISCLYNAKFRGCFRRIWINW